MEKKDVRKDAYEELTFTNNFMFCTILQNNPELCKRIVETILGVKIKKIVKPPGKEKAIDITPDGRGVRLDVYLEGDEALYDIEMQTSNDGDIRKRSRYNHGMIDLEYLDKGQPFSELKDSYVIFICTFDLFGKGLSKYTFKRLCLEDKSLELGDGTTTVFVNTAGRQDDVDEDLKSFINYLETGEIESNLTEEIEEKVKSARENKEWRMRYMTLDWELASQYRKGKEEGLEQGLEQGREDTIMALIAAGLIKEEQAEEIKKLLEKKNQES